MELFTIKRYNEKSAATPALQKNEDEILQNLLEKVEKRKRKRTQEKLIQHEEDFIEKQNKSIDEDVDIVEKADAIDSILLEDGLKDDVDPIQEPNNVGDDFEILGEDANIAKRLKVDMVLPPWLAHPTIISTSLSSDDAQDADAIANLNYLAPHIRHAMKEMQVTRLFPVQSVVIPWLLESHSKPMPFRPRDICVSAPTGSGKTLAFAIPIVQLLANRVQPKIRALVVLPVTELALQVYKVFKKLCDKTDLKVCLLSKQTPFPMEQSKLVECYKGQYYSNVDIVVTTPGRLVDHLHSTKGFCLKSLKFIVIDEADRIMDAVFQNWLYHLDSHVRSTSDQLLSGRNAPLCLYELQQNAATQPHKLLFSATLSQDPEKLQKLRLFQPKLFTSVLTNLDELREKFTASDANKQNSEGRGDFIGKYTTPAELTEKYCITESRLKPLTLFSLINENGWTKFLCFTNSAESSGRLAYVLEKLLTTTTYTIRDLSASLSAKERANVLKKFSRGAINGLICSDALARGIDVPEVDIVISYDAPRHIKTYIHRIGRTARAGRQGTAITLLTQKELLTFNKTLSEVGKVITEEIKVYSTTEEENAQKYSKVLELLRRKLEKDKRTKLILKERSRQNAALSTAIKERKDPTKMTLMEKLQVQATDAMLTKIEEEEKKDALLGSKRAQLKKKKSTFKSKKKSNVKKN